ncbi:tetratricopeptide repeat protein [Desulfonema magnum]|uniref:Tetratricopeptide repeat-containing n=1 Tax=Desulfonema magnum TaxID=45655 RepID=A0A975BJ92_9BACT|nr:hypothetical protein [Desulfonema magnum]QTA86375.1 tetratricopeptide repeat-containing [Desulfonema magnum]
MKNVSQLEIYKTLRQASENGVGWAHGNGFKWLRDVFIPYIEIARNSCSYENFFIADCFYVLGDIYDFNEAPLAAAGAYSKAIEYDNEFAAAYREMAGMCQTMGNYKKAAELISIAVTLDPKDQYALSDQKIINKDLVQKTEPLFKPSDIIWQADELLAMSEFKKALSLLEHTQNAESCKARARCYGALSDCQNYINEWKSISDTYSEFEFRSSDWFYMPKQVFDSSEIWYILFDSYKKIRPSVFISFNSLYESEKYRNLEESEKYKLIIEFNIYRTENNFKALNQLYQIYPAWSELKEFIV